MVIDLRPICKKGQRVKKGEILTEGYATENGELALGRNLLVAYMPWKGYNYADAIVLSAEGKGIQAVEAKTGNIKVRAENHLIPPAPKTGDRNWLTFYVMLLGGSFFLFALVFAARKIRKGNKK